MKPTLKKPYSDNDLRCNRPGMPPSCFTPHATNVIALSAAFRTSVRSKPAEFQSLIELFRSIADAGTAAKATITTTARTHLMMSTLPLEIRSHNVASPLLSIARIAEPLCPKISPDA